MKSLSLPSFGRLFLRSIAGAALLGACLSLPALTSGSAVAAAAEQRSPKPRRIARPKWYSNQYRLSWGLSSINADRAYARGANGAGVTVAMIDTGIAGVPANLFASVSSASTDLIAGRRHGAVKADHGQQTASLLAAALDDAGTVGVAYGSSLLSIRADIDGSCRTECAVRGEDLARGIDYAIANGARIIGVPLVGPHHLPSVEPALERAVAAGAVIVAAAGNDGSAEPSWPARYAADPRFARSMIVAGASTPAGALARWSSKASVAQARYIAAPGENVIVNCDERYCQLTSGTSYSVAYVAGALSLIMAAHPQLTAPQAADMLLAGASDRGRKGTDPVAGVGVLDVSRALRIADRAIAAGKAS